MDATIGYKHFFIIRAAQSLVVTVHMSCGQSVSFSEGRLRVWFTVENFYDLKIRILSMIVYSRWGKPKSRWGNCPLCATWNNTWVILTSDTIIANAAGLPHWSVIFILNFFLFCHLYLHAYIVAVKIIRVMHEASIWNAYIKGEVISLLTKITNKIYYKYS